MLKSYRGSGCYAQEFSCNCHCFRSSKQRRTCYATSVISTGVQVNAAVYIAVLKHLWNGVIVIAYVRTDHTYFNKTLLLHTKPWQHKLWPPSCTDLNLLDYYVWGVVEQEINKHLHNIILLLKNVIKTTITNMNKEHLI